MKKITSILLVMFIVTIIFTGCASKSKEAKQDTTTKSESNIKYVKENFSDSNEGYSIVAKGNYFLFSCSNSDTYVMFLDQLDENIYEVVDIQIEHFSDGNFWVTYKKKIAN